MNRMTGDKVSYTEMADRSLRVAAKLRSCGVREGDHVMLFSPNHENYISSVVGLMSIGAVPCLANPTYTGTPSYWILSHLAHATVQCYITEYFFFTHCLCATCDLGHD